MTASDRLSSAFRRSAGPLSGVPSASCPDESIGASPVEIAPGPDQIEVLQREAHRVHDLVARRADRIRAVRLQALPQRDRLGRSGPDPGSFRRRAAAPEAASPSRFSRIHLPRDTGDVRVATEVTVSMLPCPSRPAARTRRVERDATEVAAPDVGDAVVTGEPFVHEREIGVDQVEQAPILADDRAEEHLGFAPERLAQVVVEILRVGLHARQLTQVQPLSGEVADQRVGLRIGQHPPDLPFELLRIAEPTLDRPRPAARRRECCSTGRTTSATPAPRR